MLKDLIGSKTRQTLLSTFFGNPEKDYYVRQLASLHRMSVGTLHREIRKLEASGLLGSRRVGQIKLFFLNTQNPVYEELKNIFQKTEGAVHLVRDAVSGLPGVKIAFIYGSFAKGEERPDSDIDIFLIGDNIPEDELVGRLSGLERQLLREINYTRYTQSEYKAKKRSRDSFLAQVLKGKKVFIKGGERDL